MQDNFKIHSHIYICYIYMHIQIHHDTLYVYIYIYIYVYIYVCVYAYIVHIHNLISCFCICISMHTKHVHDVASPKNGLGLPGSSGAFLPICRSQRAHDLRIFLDKIWYDMTHMRKHLMKVEWIWYNLWCGIHWDLFRQVWGALPFYCPRRCCSRLTTHAQLRAWKRRRQITWPGIRMIGHLANL